MRAFVTKTPDAEMTRGGVARLVRSALLGLSAFAAMFALAGCGEGAPDAPLASESGQVSAKYKELHPEEFPVAKPKGSRTRRGG